ncbi:hypothetical protein [Agromyces archimandritae]|uniref:Uncharacterized protein n=1 Tax=Agromyces archimandritae TaxID=2781962 RepID=A0A975FLW1_9MICO|nr:hypothetical protein [Agromyces archimandritae]QTX03868.1 hypothetical protein G127AT_11150 [Agromyces archimandritae]
MDGDTWFAIIIGIVAVGGVAWFLSNPSFGASDRSRRRTPGGRASDEMLHPDVGRARRLGEAHEDAVTKRRRKRS